MQRCAFCYYGNTNLVKWPYNRDPVSNLNEPEGVLLVKTATNNQMLKLYWLLLILELLLLNQEKMFMSVT